MTRGLHWLSEVESAALRVLNRERSNGVEKGDLEFMEAFSRLATVHMQAASTKLLIESQQGTSVDYGTKLHELYAEKDETLVRPDRFKPDGSMTGRMFKRPGDEFPTFHPVQVTKRCIKPVRRNGELTRCNNALTDDGTCPAELWHEEQSEPKALKPMPADPEVWPAPAAQVLAEKGEVAKDTGIFRKGDNPVDGR